MWITIEQIKCLSTINYTGSINSAAIELNKAKSAVSYSINRLEEQLGFPVLDRSQYRIELTEQGQAFLHKAQRILVEMDKLEDVVGKIASGVEMRLALSTTAIYPNDQLNKVLRDVIKKFPSTELIYHREILSGEKMLLNDTVDIAIYENPGKHIDIERKQIGTTNLQLVVCCNHPFLSLPKKNQTLDELAKYPHIIQRSTIPDPEIMGSPANAPRWTVSDIDSKKDLIMNNFGWGRLPDHFISKELKNKKLVHLKKLDYDHELEIFVCKKKTKAFGPVLKYIWDSI